MAWGSIDPVAINKGAQWPITAGRSRRLLLSTAQSL
jgi:hypothetical protein